MRVLVVGLVNRPQRRPLAAAFAKLGCVLDACFSTDLIIDAASDGLGVRLRDRPLDAYDAVLLWSVGHRRWEWYLATQLLREERQIAVVSERHLDPNQTASISVAWDQLNLAQAGIPTPRTMVFADPGAGPRLYRELNGPAVLRGVRSEYATRGVEIADLEGLKAALEKRNDRAVLLAALVPATIAFRFLVVGDDVVASIKLPLSATNGLLWHTPEEPVQPFVAQRELSEVALRAARAMGLDVAELEIAEEAGSGRAVVTFVNRDLERFAMDDYGARAYEAIAGYVLSQVSDGRRSRARVAPPAAELPCPAPSQVVLSVCVLQTSDDIDPRPALHAARLMGDRVLLGLPETAPHEDDLDADEIVSLAPGLSPQAGWEALLRRAPGSFFCWLYAEDRLSDDAARALRRAFEERPEGVNALSVRWSLLQDAYGYDRHQALPARILPLREDTLFDATGLIPRAHPSLNALWLKDIAITFQPTTGGYARHLSGAIERLEAQLESRPNQLQTAFDLGEALTRDRRYAAALEVLTPLASKLDTPAARGRAFTLMSLCHLRNKDYDRAILFGRSALSQEPRLAEPRQLIGEAYYEQRRFHEARRWLEEAHATPAPPTGIALYPYWYAWYSVDMLSCACDRLGDYDAALFHLDTVEARIGSNRRTVQNRQRLDAAKARLVKTLPAGADAVLTDNPDGRRLSVCIIVRDEGQRFHSCLAPLKLFADEIIVVDTGSVDDTVEVASAYTEKLFSFAWCDDFSAARNFSLEQATGTHVMWLDSDDLITEEDARRLRVHFLNLDKEIEVVRVPYRYFTDEAGGDRFVQNRERIFVNDPTLRFKYPIHEVVQVQGRRVVTLSDVAITHLAQERPGEPRIDRNLRILKDALAQPGYEGDRHLRVHLALGLFSLDRFDEAASLLAELLDESTTHRQRARMAFRLARCHYKMGDLQAAEGCARRSMTEGPGMREPLVVLGDISRDQGDFETAASWYKRAEATPLSPWAIHRHWYSWAVQARLADLCLRQELKAEAGAWVEGVARLLPGSELLASLQARLTEVQAG